MADVSEVYINAGTPNFVPKAGSKDRSITLTTSYQRVMPENSTRVGYEFEGAIAATGTISIRYGSTGPVFEIVGGGDHIRTKATGGVYVGELWAKSTVGGDALLAQEW